jgi:hypothetical protein
MKRDREKQTRQFYLNLILYSDYIRYNLRLMTVPFFYRHSELKPETFKDILMITKG